MILAAAIRIVVNAIALWAAASWIDGIELSDRLGSVLIVALIFGLVNGFIKPIATAMSFPFVIATLGLFTLLVNAAMLNLTDFLSDGLSVEGFWTSIYGAAVVSIVSWALSMFVPDDL